jgi:hypothetical protein
VYGNRAVQLLLVHRIGLQVRGLLVLGCPGIWMMDLADGVASGVPDATEQQA